MEWNIIELDNCRSTNLYVKELKKAKELYDRTAIVTKFQQNGRGQGQNAWHSEKNKNLLVSFYRQTELSATNNFVLTIIASLSIVRCLEKYGIDCHIKWPNDIYYHSKKLSGILIENALIRDTISETTMGIGLNVNQREFPDYLPNPISVSQIINKEVDTEELLQKLIIELDTLQGFIGGTYEDIYHEYLSRLYLLNSWNLYKVDGNTFNGRIHGVEMDGRLILENGMGELKHYLFGEIEYVIQ